MNPHPITTPASPSLASPIFVAAFDSIESITTSFAMSLEPTLQTTNVTEVALSYHRPETIMKFDAAAKSHKGCIWVIFSDPANPEESNCLSLACRVYREAGIDFPMFYDPSIFCRANHKNTWLIGKTK